MCKKLIYIEFVEKLKDKKNIYDLEFYDLLFLEWRRILGSLVVGDVFVLFMSYFYV